MRSNISLAGSSLWWSTNSSFDTWSQLLIRLHGRILHQQLLHHSMRLHPSSSLEPTNGDACLLPSSKLSWLISHIAMSLSPTFQTPASTWMITDSLHLDHPEDLHQCPGYSREDWHPQPILFPPDSVSLEILDLSSSAFLILLNLILTIDFGISVFPKHQLTSTFEFLSVSNL